MLPLGWHQGLHRPALTHLMSLLVEYFIRMLNSQTHTKWTLQSWIYFLGLKMMTAMLYKRWYHESLCCGYYSFFRIYKSMQLYPGSPGLVHGCANCSKLLTLFTDKTNHEFMCIACIRSKLPRMFCYKRINTSLSNCSCLFYCTPYCSGLSGQQS